MNHPPRAPLATDWYRILVASASFIPTRLVRSQLTNPEPGRIRGEFWQGSLLSADLSGFTPLSERLSTLGRQGAEEVSRIINQIFSTLLDEVHAHYGEVLKFIGDELIVFFDAETLGSAHAAAATSAALAMQARMEAEFGRVETPLETFALKLRIGIHSGRVFAAEVGDQEHIELVVTGLDMNRVARAQKFAAPGEVIISDQTAGLLAGAHLRRRKAGFQQVLALPTVELPLLDSMGMSVNGFHDEDPESVELLTTQVAALRPYLVRGLPRRFLDPSFTEIGEFRPVSVLFINFYNFSALLKTMGNDANQAALILNAYFSRVQSVVHHYDGTINKVDMSIYGDRLMVLFGAPTAHEDDPVRAVHCAIALETTLAEANAEIAALLNSAQPSPLAQRMGISTGTVFAGLVGGEQRYEYTVMGQPVNLAVRLMEAAQEGVILLSPLTRTAVEHQIAVIDQPPVLFKGMMEPLTPARALHVFDEEQMPLRLSEISLTHPPLVGREHEMELLTSEAAVALRGSGRVLAIVGEAGIGKTRLTTECVRDLVLASIDDEQDGAADSVPHFLMYSGDRHNYEQGIPYITIRTTLRYLLDIHRSDDEAFLTDEAVESFWTKVERLAPHLARFAPLLSDVLGVILPESPLTQSLTAEQRHNRVQELIIALVLGTAAVEPLLLIFDDLHWADASSLQLLSRLAYAVERAPVLLLLSYRPTPLMEEGWVNLSTTTRLVLDELSPKDSIALLEGLLDGPPPPALISLLDRTQGNPFFIQELVRALAVSGALARNEAGRWHLTRSLDQVALPKSIEGLIQSYLDQLDEAEYELVQIASVIGNRFEPRILEGIYQGGIPLQESLEHLVDAEIIVSRGQGSHASYASYYLFRHALLRDVAYESILFSRRRELHRQVAQRLEELCAEQQDEYLALAAQHYVLAEAWEPAFHYHREAGIQAQQRYANREALAFFATALDISARLLKTDQSEGRTEGIVSRLPPTIIPPEIIDLYERRGNIYVLLAEYEAAYESYRAALTVLEQWREEYISHRLQQRDTLVARPPFSTMVVRLHRLLASVQEHRDDYDGAFHWLGRGMAQGTSDAYPELIRCYLLGATIYQHQGEYTRSLDWARRALADAQYLESLSDQASALLLIGNCWREQGGFSASIDALEQARALFEQLNDSTRLSDAMNNLGKTYWRVGRWREAVRYFEQALQISESIGDVLMKARTSNNLAAVMVGRGALSLADELYAYSYQQFTRIGSVMGTAVTNLHRGEVMLLQGKPREALALFKESIATLERIKARTNLPDVLRLAAEATLALGQHEQATVYAARSLAIANELGMAISKAVAQRILGQIALSKHDFTTAQMLFQTSRTGLEQIDSPFQLGKVIYWQARLMQALKQTEQVLVLLKEAEQIFFTLGARSDLAAVRGFLQEVVPKEAEQ